MSDNPRDTQFKGFAAALFCDLPWHDINIDMDTDGWEDRWEALIARRAYDLVSHAINKLELCAFETCEKRSDLVDTIPDMPELPKEQAS